MLRSFPGGTNEELLENDNRSTRRRSRSVPYRRVRHIGRYSFVRTGTSSMPVKTKIDSTSRTGPLRQGKGPKGVLVKSLSVTARSKGTGAASEREAVEMALSLVSFRRELRSGVRALRKL